MGKKIRKVAKEQDFQSRKAEEKRMEESPFSQIVLKEKSENTIKKESSKQRKKASEVVGGYNPNASFADILANFERTGNPYSMPKKGSAQKSATSFADIFAQWEKKDKKPEAKEHKKSTYRATKSFAEILNEYEGNPVAAESEAVNDDAAIAEKEDTPSPSAQGKSEYRATRSFASILSEFEGGGKERKGPVASRVDEEFEISLEKDEVKAEEESPLFRKEGDEEWEKRNPDAAWSIYGNNESFERKEEIMPEKPIAEEKVEEKAQKEIRKSTYKATKDFGEILEGFYAGLDGSSSGEIAEEVKEAEEQVFKEENPLKSEDDGEKRSTEASWSIYGKNGEDRKKEGKEKGRKEFSRILDSYESKKKEVKTFDEIIKEKGDIPEKREYTLSQLRNMLPQATLDLHGKTQQEAEEAVKSFLDDCRSHNIRKLSIITGKGLHSEGGQGVLRDAVMALLDKDGGISERFNAPMQYGGSGALWVILKKN